MTLKTVPVTGILYNPDGSVAANAVVVAQLTTVDTDGGVVVPGSVSTTTDAGGVFTLSLWPNSRGVNGSQYLLRAQMPGALPGVLLMNLRITVPDSDPSIPVPVSMITNRTLPSALSDAKAAMLAAQAAAVQAQQALAAAIAVAGDQTNVNALAASLSMLNTLAADLANLNAVAADLANINTLASDKANLDLLAANIASINAAVTAAQAAASSALTAGQAVAAIGGTTATRLASAINTAYRNAYQPRPKFELYIPQITSLAQLTAPAGLAIHGSGVGVVAAVNGTNGTATIPIPANIDRTLPFIFALKFEVNEDVNTLYAQLTNATKDFWSGPRLVTARQSAISINAGVGAPINTIMNPSVDGGSGAGGADGPIPAGTQFWLVCVGTGDATATYSLIPDIAVGALDTTPVRRTPAFKGKYNRLNYTTDPLSNVGAGAGKFTYGDTSITSTLLSQVYLQNASSTSRIIGMYLCVGEIAGPADYQLGVPGFMVSNVNQEPTGGGVEQTILLPRDYGGPKDTSLVLHMHPNGNPGQLGQSLSMPVVPQLFYAGYAQASMTAAQTAAEFAGATSSNWGAPTGLMYRRNLDEWYRRFVPYLGRRFAFGMSMGGLNALRYFAEYGDLTAIVTVSGAVDLTDGYNNRGFSALINAGYGAWYRCKVANTGNDPATSPTQWAPINAGVLSVSPRYTLAPQNWKTGTAWAAGTAYALNDVVFKAYTGGIAGLASYDPTQNPTKFTGVPIKMWHGDSDVTVPSSQMTGFAAAVNAAGGSVQTVLVPGGTHLGATMYDPPAIQAFFDQFRDL